MHGPVLNLQSTVAALFLLSLTGCTTLEDFFGTTQRDRNGGFVPMSERAVDDPAAPNRFVLTSAQQKVIGEPQVVYPGETDTLSDLAREYGLGYDEIIEANPDVSPWLPGAQTPVLLPTQYVLPDVPHKGIVLNIASKRLFYFPEVGVGRDQIVFTYPIGIGRVGWETPLGATEVVSKAMNPTWWVPASVRAEHAEMGNPLPKVMPPGPDNPLGTRVLKLEMPGYLIHGTNAPYGVGMRVSHGCVRLYPENIEFLYELVMIGEPVLIINEPYLLGQQDDEWYFESHRPLQDDLVDSAERLSSVLQSAGDSLPAAMQEHARAVASIANGVPVRLGQYDADEVLGRAHLVRNTVEQNPDDPTLEEVRDLINEAVAEAEREAVLDSESL